MATFPTVTKQQIHEMNAEFSSICTEEKSKSSSPFHGRKIYIAPRRRAGKQPEHNSGGFQFHDISEQHTDEIFQQMSEQQYKQYQVDSMQSRMKRKRNFDAFSSQSDSSLHCVLQNANTFRVPSHCLFYVRVNQNQETDSTLPPNHQPSSSAQTQSANAFELLINGSKSMTDWNSAASRLQLETENAPQDEQKKAANAFELLINGSKSMTDWNSAASRLQLETENAPQDEQKGATDDDDEEEEDAMMRNTGVPYVVYPISEECPITRCVRVSSEWVRAYTEYDAANTTEWKQSNAHGKVHEYQINRSHGIILVNLDESPYLKGVEQRASFWEENEQNIKQWALDHSYSGVIVNACFHLYQPHLYWNLLDDDKQCKVKQALISDMFQSAKTKPTKSPW
eukprot:CAMPEP_0197077068 /NCGR_PEP_ID=MMETSP1384-20130603/212432_1 /TAXON_ID=29189 /ORGANISM="Ammonia sp." /LENGTH=396 /DNA_ID=CAMNT_0042515927 /DNA_START=77 /DNA_END=1263 /DNA_ORIENTATION=+